MEEEKKNKRKATILMIVGVITLIALVVGATYAYFSAQVGTGDKAQINAKAGTTDDLTFATTGPITITANQTNFAQGEESLSDSATATAHLIAGDDDNTATEHYYLYLQIDANNLTYTVGKDQPELIMEITDPNKQPYTEPIEGLEYKENITDGKGVNYSGYDITEAKGLFAIAKNYEIIASNDKTDTWTIKVTFLNLSTDQHENTDKTLTGKLIIQKEKKAMPILDKLLADANKDNVITLYHHNGTILAPNTLLEIDNNALIGGYKITKEHIEEYSQINDELIKKSCNGQDANIEQYVSDCDGYNAKYTNKYYLEYKGKETLYDTYKKALQQAIDDKYVEPDIIDASDDSYRYSGASEEVNNYICFGGECSSDSANPGYKYLYRIMGAYKNDDGNYELKLIKADGSTKEDLGDDPDSAYSGNYGKANLASYSFVRDDIGDNMWKDSALNKKNLNEIYYNNFVDPYKKLIIKHSWSVGGVNPFGFAKAIYDKELGINKLKETDEACYNPDSGEKRLCSQEEDLEYSAHIGLMYVSDYLYGVSPEYWSMDTSNYSRTNVGIELVKKNNWLNIDVNEWTITRDYSSNFGVWMIFGDGDTSSDTGASSTYVARPTFYLSSDIQIASGNGSKENPYRLELE